jgi:hypothetical protein
VHDATTKRDYDGYITFRDNCHSSAAADADTGRDKAEDLAVAAIGTLAQRQDNVLEPGLAQFHSLLVG